ncbi:MAG: MBL fold metallo-hydrolase [Chloroflexi bacterium]|nr:MBL fold metallo-hydrolase [Chloroflexota bacterium]
MQITFAGTGCGAVHNPARAGSGIHLSHGDSSLLLDCGPGVLEQLLRAGIEHTDVQAVIFSHLHMDHAIGIAELLAWRAFQRRDMPAVYGPLGTTEYLAVAIEYAHANGSPRLTAHHVEMDELQLVITRPDDEQAIGPWQVTTREVPHVDYLECLARRFDADGRSLVYSGDTRPAPEIMVPLADGVDVLIHEAFSWTAIDAFVEGRPKEMQEAIRSAFKASHCDVHSAAQIAQQAGVSQLVLTHLLPQEQDAALVTEASTQFDGEILVAQDQLRIDL